MRKTGNLAWDGNRFGLQWIWFAMDLVNITMSRCKGISPHGRT